MSKGKKNRYWESPYSNYNKKSAKKQKQGSFFGMFNPFSGVELNIFEEDNFYFDEEINHSHSINDELISIYFKNTEDLLNNVINCMDGCNIHLDENDLHRELLVRCNAINEQYVLQQAITSNTTTTRSKLL